MLSTTIIPPTTYSERISLLNMFKERKDDQAILDAMQQGTIEWQAGVAERFSRKLIDAINFRMNAATDRFQTEMGRSNGQEHNIVQALLALRKELIFLSKAICIQAIPENERQQYYQLVVEQAQNIQNSLENSAKKDRSGKLASIIRNNRVNVF